MSDFKYIGKNIVCEPYTFRSSITASSISASGTISAKRFVGYIDSASVSVSSSFALTASYALNAGSGTSLGTGSTYPITASWAVSSSYSTTSSILYIITSSYIISSSFASSSISSSYALSSSYSLTASYALNAGSGTSLGTGSTYPITSSWSLYSISSSYADTALSSAFAYSSSYSLTASYALNAGSGGGGIFVATSSIIDINFSSSVDKFVTDGVNNTYTLTLPSTNPNDLLVFLDGLEQEPTTDYTVSGTTFTMTSIPPANLELEVRKFYSAATISIITSSLNAQYFIGDGVTTQYVLTKSVSNDYDVLVSFDGLIQKPTYDYTITGSILNFTSPPPTNIDGEIRYLMGSTTSLISGSGNSVSSSYAVTSSYVNTLDQIVILSQVSSSLNFANDGAASLGGVPLGGLYRNGNVIQIRLV
jgi:hypothetical protein